MNELLSKILFKKRDKRKIVSSLIPLFKKDKLLNILNIFTNDKVKSQELLNLFTYRKDIKLDLQYTPFLQVSGCIVFSNTLVTKSNLLRNAIAYSYLIKNQTANDDQGLEPLVKECRNIFQECKIDVFCKYFLQKVASNFSIVLQLHFPQCCKSYFLTSSVRK